MSSSALAQAAFTRTASPSSAGSSPTRVFPGCPAPFAPGKSLGEALLTPTRLYVRPLLALHRAGLLKAAAHITGGGLPGNLPRVLPEGVAATIDARARPLPPVFPWLARTGGVSGAEMLRVFNCGIGMVAVVADAAAARGRCSATISI